MNSSALLWSGLLGMFDSITGPAGGVTRVGGVMMTHLSIFPIINSEATLQKVMGIKHLCSRIMQGIWEL